MTTFGVFTDTFFSTNKARVLISNNDKIASSDILKQATIIISMFSTVRLRLHTSYTHITHIYIMSLIVN